MKTNQSPSCPECGSANESGALFCTTCGHDLIAKTLDWRARVLFFATPPFLLCLGMGFAYDLRVVDSFDVGAEWGLSLAFIYLLFGGGFWGTSHLMQFPISSHFPWVAGIFAILQAGAVTILVVPLRWLYFDAILKPMTSEKTVLLLFGVFLVLFLPSTLTGLYFLARISRHPKAWRGPPGILLFTLLLPGVLYLTLSEGDRHYLFGQLQAEFYLNDNAIDQLNRALAKNPDDPRLLGAKARLLLRREGKTAAREAAELLTRALKADPTNPGHFRSLAIAQDVAGNSEEAIAAASAAAGLRPEEVSSQVELGDFYIKAFRRKEALEVYRRALPKAPDHPLLLNNVAYLMLELNVEVPSALMMARKAAEKKPNDPSCLDTLAWALYLNGAPAEAYSIMKELKAKSGGNPVIEFHYAVIAQELGLLNEPERVFKRLLSVIEPLGDPLLYEQAMAAVASLTTNPKPSREDPPAERSEP
jgi:Flp pilus assembly protein TadD